MSMPMPSNGGQAPDPADPAHVPIRRSRFGYGFWLWIIAALFVGGATGWFGSSQIHQDDLGRQYRLLVSSYELNMAQNQHDQEALQAQLDATQGQLLVEESTRKSLEAALLETQTELGRARDQLAFFDRLLPPGPSGALSVRALDIEQRGPTLYYKALFMRNAPGGEMFSGRIEFIANGTRNGKTVKIPLQAPKVPAPQTVASEADSLALDFDQFQRVEGLLALPEGFVPKTVTLNVLDGNTVRVSRTVNLPSDE